jgi:murein DD-endopeptidase MepM/ murein hydrolase activator NlpD
VPRKKGTQPVTLIVVPHSERAPISLRLPTWLLPLCFVSFITLVAGAAFLAARTHLLSQELRDLQQDRQIGLAREREMRNTILAQQEEVRGLSLLVEDFQAELAGVSVLSGEIRDLLGLPEPSRVPIAEGESLASSPYETTLGDMQTAAVGAEAKGGWSDDSPAGHSMALAVEMGQDVVGMQVTLPSTFRELLNLRGEMLERMERIEPENRTNFADLEEQLRLLAAAPALWPTETHRISSKFGYRTLLGKLEFHKGIDIPVWYGTEIRATSDGVVVSAGWQPGYGWTIELEHEMGFATIFGHNSQLLVSEGDEVVAGEVIALSGNSGRSTGPHLHYEIRLNGTSVDPLKYLDADKPSLTAQ